MKVPKVVKYPSGFSFRGVVLLCRYWQAEEEWNGRRREAQAWKEMADKYQESLDKNINGWLSSPVIYAKMKEKGQPNFLHPYEKRFELEYI